MDQSYIYIRGGRKLHGTIRVQGSKNTVLPVLASCLLCRGITVLTHCPKIQDVYMMTAAMRSIGCQIKWEGDTLFVDTSADLMSDLPSEYTGSLRASVLLMGALLSRNGKVSMGKPGGCRIGSRPIDFHLRGFKSLGACIGETEKGYFCTGKRLSGCRICLPFPSVGATENLLLASVTAEGKTEIEGGAKEPEVMDLILHLKKMGADITVGDTGTIHVRGVRDLLPAADEIPSDRIAAATYLIAAAGTGGCTEIICRGGYERIANILPVLQEMGAGIEKTEKGLILRMDGRVRPVCLSTGPHPMLPTDVQSMLLAVLVKADGNSVIEENIFESRYQIVTELKKMGARIEVDGKRAKIMPADRLYGNDVYAADLRGGAALILSGLMAEGVTRVHSLSYLKRGYEDIANDFFQLGAEIREVNR